MNRKKICYKIEILKEVEAENVEMGKEKLFDEFREYPIIFVTAEKSKRTIKQNKALHKYLSDWSNLLNENGVTFPMIIAKSADIPITPELLKESIWKPIMKKLFDITSTTEMDKDKQIDMVVDVITKVFGELFGLYTPFPDKDKLK